jgi:amidase
MTDIPELAFLDATAQADLVRRKEVTSLELVEAAIARIERLNPLVNAVVTPLFDEALQAAQGLLPVGPFAGVPFLLKDILASYAGAPLTFGSRWLKDYRPDHDSELVTRYKQAGLIILGRTNVPEFGLLPTTEPELFGPCRNPWDLTRTPGGSSGGSAAAVSAGIVPMAHGNDGGGSIRIPASCCGLFGLKPTRGRNPLGPDFGDLLGGLIVEHALTRTVRDSATLLDATCGPDLGDPYWAPPKARPYIREVGDDPGTLHVAYTTDSWSDADLNPDCRQAVLSVAEQLTELGHRVEETSPLLDRESLARWFTVTWAAGCASTIEAVTAGRAESEMFEPLTWMLYVRYAEGRPDHGPLPPQV